MQRTATKKSEVSSGPKIEPNVLTYLQNIIMYCGDESGCVSSVYRNAYYTYVSSYIPPREPHVAIKFSINARGHCGYCSDNDGTIHDFGAIEETVYIRIPEWVRREKNDMDRVCPEQFHPQSHSQCYCGNNIDTWTVTDIQYLPGL